MTCYGTARCGHLAVLQWARQQGCPWDATTCQGAAFGGHLAMLQWLRQQGCLWDREDCRNIAPPTVKEWMDSLPPQTRSSLCTQHFRRRQLRSKMCL